MIAYRQPIIRADIEHIRGVDCGAMLRQLMERKLIRVLGRKEIPGRPLIYATTKTFLELFELKDLSELPTPAEIEQMGAIINGEKNDGPKNDFDSGTANDESVVTAPGLSGDPIKSDQGRPLQRDQIQDGGSNLDFGESSPPILIDLIDGSADPAAEQQKGYPDNEDTKVVPLDPQPEPDEEIQQRRDGAKDGTE